MIAYLNGKLSYVFEDNIVIDVNGVGYNVFVSSYTISQLKAVGSDIKVFTYMSVREDAINLYGFITLDEMNMFNRLITVSGIGPKVALGVLSAMRPNELCMAIVVEDIKALSNAPGIGKKTAQRIILDLKDKIKTEDTFADKQILTDVVENDNAKKDTIDALMSLGYSQAEAMKSLMNIDCEGKTAEMLIKEALKKMI